MAFLYGRAGRLIAQNGLFRPGQNVFVTPVFQFASLLPIYLVQVRKTPSWLRSCHLHSRL
jgi:hypothetical protein